MTTQVWYMKNNGMFDGVDLYSDDAAEQLHSEYASRNAGDWDLSNLYTSDMVYQSPVGELFDDPDTTMILVAEFDYDDDFAEVIA